jgi:hypothetical protein
MRRILLIPAAFALFMAGPVSAQQGEIPELLSFENFSLTDRFRITLPGKAKVMDTTWTSLNDVVYPARVYSVENGGIRDSLTVIDYTEAERLNRERRQKCAPGIRCLPPDGYETDLRGAIDYSTWRLTQKYTKLTYIGWDWQDRVEGRLLRFTNADGSRTTAVIHMHENRLYVVESTQPEGVPERPFVHQSLQFLDKDGHLVRYKTIYSNLWPAPDREEQEGDADFRKRNIEGR